MSFDRRTYARLWRREFYQKQLRRKRLPSRVCPRRFGRFGVCGGLLISFTDGRGGLVVRCPRCEKFEAGICRDCPLPVDGAVRRARFCAAHRITATRVSQSQFKAENRELIARRVRKAHRANKALREKKAAYKRLWRKANPEKVKAQKRREALRQNPRVYEYHREYRIKNGISGRHQPVGARTCLGCPTSVSGRTKKCPKCKERERVAAIAFLSPVAGRGKRNDLRRTAA